MQQGYSSAVCTAMDRMRRIEEQARQVNSEIAWLMKNMNDPRVAFTPQLRSQMGVKLSRLQGRLATLQNQYSMAFASYQRAIASANQHAYMTECRMQQQLMNQQQREMMSQQRMFNNMYGGNRRGW